MTSSKQTETRKKLRSPDWVRILLCGWQGNQMSLLRALYRNGQVEKDDVNWRATRQEKCRRFINRRFHDHQLPYLLISDGQGYLILVKERK